MLGHRGDTTGDIFHAVVRLVRFLSLVIVCQINTSGALTYLLRIRPPSRPIGAAVRSSSVPQQYSYHKELISFRAVIFRQDSQMSKNNNISDIFLNIIKKQPSAFQTEFCQA